MKDMKLEVGEYYNPLGFKLTIYEIDRSKGIVRYSNIGSFGRKIVCPYPIMVEHIRFGKYRKKEYDWD